MKNVEVVLAVNIIAYELFYKTQPLANQELIIDPIEIAEVLTQYEISSHRMFHIHTSEKPSADMFIVRAEDNLDNIIDVVQRNMQYIFIITPHDEVSQTIKNNYTLFIKNNNLGGISDTSSEIPTPPSPENVTKYKVTPGKVKEEDKDIFNNPDLI